MGLFDKLFKQSKELTNAANAIANVRNLLDRYETDPDFINYLCLSAWITTVGFLDIAERNNWLPNYTLFVPINGHQTRMTMTEAMMQTMGRIMSKAQQLSDEKAAFINEIFEKGDAFYTIEQQLPYNVISMFKK